MFGVSWVKRYKEVEEMERDLGLTFKGEGWYFTQNDATLIVPRGTGFVAHVWSGKDGRQMLLDLAHYPNRTLADSEKIPNPA